MSILLASMIVSVQSNHTQSCNITLKLHNYTINDTIDMGTVTSIDDVLYNLTHIAPYNISNCNLLFNITSSLNASSLAVAQYNMHNITSCNNTVTLILDSLHNINVTFNVEYNVECDNSTHLLNLSLYNISTGYTADSNITLIYTCTGDCDDILSVTVSVPTTTTTSTSTTRTPVTTNSNSFIGQSTLVTSLSPPVGTSSGSGNNNGNGNIGNGYGNNNNGNNQGNGPNWDPSILYTILGAAGNR